MAGYVDSTPAERAAQLATHVDAWIAIGLRTGPADRAAFEAAARRCHEYAQIPWHGNVVWVDSPLVLCWASFIAEQLMRRHRPERMSIDDVMSALFNAVVYPVFDAVGGGLAPQLELELGDANRVVRGALRGVGAMDEDEGICTLVAAVAEATADMLSDGLLDAVDSAARSALLGIAQNPGIPLDGQTPSARQLAHIDPYLSVIEGQFLAGVYQWGGLQASILRDLSRLELPGDLWDRARTYEQTLQHACWWYPHRDFLMVCEHPKEIHRELRNPDVRRGPASHRLHRTDGPAAAWPDGWGIHVVHGVPVPGWIIERPETITVGRIEQETNAEVRRVMLDRYGWARYVADCGAQVVDKVPADHAIAGLRGARLLRKVLPGEPEPIVYLEMVNSTPEPDGTHRRYLERIDPNAYNGDAGRFCHAALASRWHHRDDQGRLQRTFRRWQDYRPTVES
jgi:hypothetical protein